MKPPRFDYVRPESVEEALAVLSEHGDDAKVLAGGQSFVPMLNMRLASPAVVVDVNRLRGLCEIVDEALGVKVGALVRQAQTESSPVVQGHCPMLAECLPYVGHFVTRNRGTVGGSIAHADAKAELPLALLTTGGAAVAASVRGTRAIFVDDLLVTHFTTSLEPDELLVEIRWGTPPGTWGYAFEEFALRRGDYALAMAACALRVENGKVHTARVAIAGPCDRPSVIQGGALLVGETVTAELARVVCEAARSEVEPVDSLHA